MHFLQSSSMYFHFPAATHALFLPHEKKLVKNVYQLKDFSTLLNPKCIVLQDISCSEVCRYCLFLFHCLLRDHSLNTYLGRFLVVFF